MVAMEGASQSTLPHSQRILPQDGHLSQSTTDSSVNDIFCPFTLVILYSFCFCASNLHVLGAILLLFISKRLTFRTLVLQYIFYFHPLTNKFASFFVYFQWNYSPYSNHFTLCNSFLQEPKNWLRSTLIDVQSIDRVSISVKYTITPFCSSQPSNTFCTDNIGVYVWESVSHVTTDLIPDPRTSNSSYREFATIRGQASGQTISLELQATRRYIVLGFLDQGGCKILSSVRITYNICPKTTLHERLVDLRETVAPFSVFEPILVEGTCTVDSFHIQGSLNVTCKSSGQWNVSQFEAKCVCNEDKENAGGTCTGMFRSQYNNDNSLRGWFYLLSVD